MPSERSFPPPGKNQLQSQYSQTLDLAQPPEAGGRFSQTSAFSQPHAGGTRRSTPNGSGDGPASYLSVGRDWGNTAREDRASSAVDYGPMSNWEHQLALMSHGMVWEKCLPE